MTSQFKAHIESDISLVRYAVAHHPPSFITLGKTLFNIKKRGATTAGKTEWIVTAISGCGRLPATAGELFLDRESK